MENKDEHSGDSPHTFYNNRIEKHTGTLKLAVKKN